MKNNHLKIAVNKEPKLPQGGEKIIPCKLKKWGFMAMLGAASLLALNSCGKDEPEDPTKAKIEALKAQEKQQAAEVRDAVEPALKQPDDIEGFYWNTFNNGNVPRRTLYDSTKVHISVINNIRMVYGNPISFNNETLSNLYDKSKTYIATVDELNQLQK